MGLYYGKKNGFNLRRCVIINDLTGKQFGRLTVIEKSGYVGKKIAWLCKCECDNTTIVSGSNLVTKAVQSCGCLNKANTKHGMRYTKIYKIWESMKRRCLNPKVERYMSYGGRGIKFCDEWNNFIPFYEWAKSAGYKEGLSIDRIDVDGNYEPNNCRWITMKEQSNNKTTSNFVTYKGEIKTIPNVAEETKIPYFRLYQRIVKLGWNIERAVLAG